MMMLCLCIGRIKTINLAIKHLQEYVNNAYEQGQWSRARPRVPQAKRQRRARDFQHGDRETFSKNRSISMLMTSIAPLSIFFAMKTDIFSAFTFLCSSLHRLHCHPFCLFDIGYGLCLIRHRLRRSDEDVNDVAPTGIECVVYVRLESNEYALVVRIVEVALEASDACDDGLNGTSADAIVSKPTVQKVGWTTPSL